MTADIAERVRRSIVHPSIRSVRLIGSRANGDATSFSDWDFSVETDDFKTAAEALPTLAESLDPLAQLWDPLADIATYMVILSGPTKVDFLFVDQVAEHSPPHVVRRDTLADIDTHFWDWCLWLTSKVASGKNELVDEELSKMATHILQPMAIDRRPKGLREAVKAYLDARETHETRLGVQVQRELGTEVARVVEATTGRLA
ncbi:MAG: nucleotidyltransferase domain-containing protein [Actinomycetota bacterium]